VRAFLSGITTRNRFEKTLSNNVLFFITLSGKLVYKTSTMRYPASFIERVKNHFKLSEVIGRRVDLRRHGREFQACCPFHSEKTPSFTVNDEKGFYHCFGCGAHGDAIVFLMEHERLHYKEAIDSLAKQAGIPLPTPDVAEAHHYDREERLLRLMDDAVRWFAAQLQSSVGHAARNYLRDRDIGQRTIESFDIGYAPQTREGLKLAMQQLGHSETQMLDVGLLIKIDNKSSYDRFRGRVMFPIRRNDGRVIAFGGRLLEKNEHAPKYLNSPETILFKKHEVLFNLYQVRKLVHTAPTIVVVEGYTDVISLHTHGITYAVAPLGTAFTEAHLQQLWRYHSNPILCFDGDKAGQKAMIRAAELALPLVKAGQLLRFCGLPNGEDPDSFVRGSGLASMEGVLQRSLSLSELLWNIHIGNREFKTPEDLATAEHLLMQAVMKIHDAGLKHRIVTSFRNRLWHMGKQQNAKAQDITQIPPISARAQDNVIKHLHGQDTSLLEQVFALVARFPAMLSDAEVEHAFYEWDWSGTCYHDCLAEVLAQAEQLSNCRYVFSEYLTREFPSIDIRLQKLYTQGIIPTQLYGKEEAEGMSEARAVFKRLKQKHEQRIMRLDLQKLVQTQRVNADETGATQLLELIKIQQKANALTAEVSDDSYV
jgi:DNA primase catalytic core